MKLRYQYRIYPTPEQRHLLAKTFGCVRVVYNDALAYCQEEYKLGNKKPSESELQKKFITHAKTTEEKEWLSEVSSTALQQSISDLGTAYKNFFDSHKGTRKGKKLGHPKFKKRKSRQSFRLTRYGFNVRKSGKLFLAKIGEIKVIWSRPLPAVPSSVTVIKDCADRYFVSFVVEHTPAQLPDNGQSVGVDLGITDFATLSTGEKIKSPKPLKKRLKKVKRLHRKLSKTQKGSKRRERARKRLAKQYAKVSDTRNDFLHKLSTRLIRENQTVVLEDLNTAGLLRNRKLSRAISDLGWRSFRDMLEAKSMMYGRDVRIISRWEPTSQKCSCCGFNGGKKKLKVREWQCLNCGTVHDRDINAAINIKVAGGQSETKNGRGGKYQTIAKIATPCESSTILNLYNYHCFKS
ncbi:MAG: RNA-guided endonuclease InsQ/TnpB family protein [Microcoleaceae cyanobacterium]